MPGGSAFTRLDRRERLVRGDPNVTATIWKQLFAFSFVLLALLAVSVPFQRPGSAARVITIVSAALILVTLLGASALIALDWDPF